MLGTEGVGLPSGGGSQRRGRCTSSRGGSRLSSLLGEQAWRDSGLGVPGDVEQLRSRITTLEQQVIRTWPVSSSDEQDTTMGVIVSEDPAEVLAACQARDAAWHHAVAAAEFAERVRSTM